MFPQHFNASVSEVHLVFDKPGREQFNPKQFEQSRRDKQMSTNHLHTTFAPNSRTPNGWQEVINCRECKQSIIEAIGLSLLQIGRFLVQFHQKIILANCFSGDGENNAWLITAGDTSIPTPLPQYLSNAEEANYRIWRHFAQCSVTNVLIYSPDTDVYNIGLHTSQSSSKQFLVQLNIPSSLEQKYVDINNLQTALYNDPDLPKGNLVDIMQTLFIYTGCDYISYFKQIGKSSFFNYFSNMHVLCGSGMDGSLHET